MTFDMLIVDRVTCISKNREGFIAVSGEHPVEISTKAQVHQRGFVDFVIAPLRSRRQRISAMGWLLPPRFCDPTAASGSNGIERFAGRATAGSRRIQPFIPTHSLNLSAGVWKPSVLRGRSFICLAIESSWSCE